MWLGDTASAQAWTQRACDLNPGDWRVWMCLSVTSGVSGALEAAGAARERTRTIYATIDYQGCVDVFRQMGYDEQQISLVEGGLRAAGWE